MADLYDVDQIGPDTTLTGLLGWPVAASLSPWMHNRAVRAAGLDARYLPFPEADAGDFMLNAPAWGLRGVSVTRPHKQVVLPWLDRIAQAARGCGAVNTVTFRDGQALGDNTDAGAAVAALVEALPAPAALERCRVAILGAGGAARAVAWGAARAGAQVTLHARRLEQAQAVADLLGVAAGPLAGLAAQVPEILVNATPVGAWPDTDVSPWAAAPLASRLVFDLISNPRRTRLLAAALEQGLAIQDGMAMLVRQGEEQYRLWHGQAPARGAFAAAAAEGLRRHAAATGSG
jgi:shikimate dehydrogenase